jgi:hypothetical protein
MLALNYRALHNSIACDKVVKPITRLDACRYDTFQSRSKQLALVDGSIKAVIIRSVLCFREQRTTLDVFSQLTYNLVSLHIIPHH